MSRRKKLRSIFQSDSSGGRRRSRLSAAAHRNKGRGSQERYARPPLPFLFERRGKQHQAWLSNPLSSLRRPIGRIFLHKIASASYNTSEMRYRVVSNETENIPPCWESYYRERISNDFSYGDHGKSRSSEYFMTVYLDGIMDNSLFRFMPI